MSGVPADPVIAVFVSVCHDTILAGIQTADFIDRLVGIEIGQDAGIETAAFRTDLSYSGMDRLAGEFISRVGSASGCGNSRVAAGSGFGTYRDFSNGACNGLVTAG